MWAVIVGALGIDAIGGQVYTTVVTGKVPYIWGYVLGAWIWAPAVLRASRRQGLRPLWFWCSAGFLGGLMIVVPIWERGREFKSRSRAMTAWFIWAAFLVFLGLQFAGAL